MILIIYSKPFETAFLARKAREICKLVSVEESAGRILADCSEASLDNISYLIEKAETWSSEVKLKCKSRNCRLGDICGPDRTCLVNSRLILVLKTSKGCEVKIGPESERTPSPPFPIALFYTSLLEDLRERVETLINMENKLVCSD